MKTKILIGLGMAVSFVVGGVTGYFIRKRQEVQFVECTEEELQQFAAETEGKDDPNTLSMAAGEKDSANTVDNRKVDYTAYWNKQKNIASEIKEQIDGVYNNPNAGVGEEEDVSVTDEDLDPDFKEAIENTEDIPDLVVPGQVVPSNGNEFYEDSDETKITIFWYDRDDTVTMVDGGDPDMSHEEVVPDPLEEFRFDIKKEFEKCRADELDFFGEGTVLYRKNPHLNIQYQIIRYPSSYAKRKAQEEFGHDAYNGMQPD